VAESRRDAGSQSGGQRPERDDSRSPAVSSRNRGGVVMRLLRGQSLDQLSRELGVEAQWLAVGLAGGLLRRNQKEPR
jgi:hypothetical protein